MKNWLKGYVVEFGTFVVCGSICAGILFSMYGDDVMSWSRRYFDVRATPSGAVLVCQVDSGVALFGGDTLRDAVESEVARIRRLMRQSTTPEGPVVSWRQSRDIRDTLSATERQRCRNMAGADFRDGDLRGVDLRGMNLSQGDFRGADLSGARLDGAFLRDANFEGANLSDIDFRGFGERGLHLGPTVEGVRFQRSNFEGVFVGRGLQGADFRDANLRNASLYAFSTEAMDIRGADLRGARFTFVYGQHHDREATFDDALRTLVYDDTTQVEGLRLGAVLNTRLPFVQWAVAHGAQASFPQKDPISGRWALRHWENYAVICEGPSVVAALSGHVAALRQEIETVTGLDYPVSASWGEVVQAMQALSAEARGPLNALLESTRGIDLQGVDLSGMDLRGLDFDEAIFRGAKLVGADLSDAILDRAYVVDTDLRNARLHRTSLKGVSMRESNLEGSEWRDCNARGIRMTAVSVTGTELTCVNFTRANFNDVSFAGAELADVSVRRALLENTRFTDTVLTALDWRGSILRWSHFEGAIILENDFSGAMLHELAFSESAFGAPSRWEETILGPDQYNCLPGQRIIAMLESGGGRLEIDSEVLSRIHGQRRQYLLSPSQTPMVTTRGWGGRSRERSMS